MIGLFKHSLEPLDVLALSALILVLGGLRIASILMFTRERRVLETVASEKDST